MTESVGRKHANSTAELITGCQGLVRSIAWKIHQRLPPHVELDDLVGYGQIGLAEAARDYDPNHQTQFTTYAYYRIRGSILDGLSRLAWFSQSDYVRGRYERLTQEVLQSDQEQDGKDSAGSKLTEDVRWFKRATGALAVVYLMCQGSDRNRADQEIASNQRSPVDAAINSDLTNKLRRLVEDLPSDARELIRGAYFDGLSLKEAGERIGISKAWASRLHAWSLQKLARGFSAEIE